MALHYPGDVITTPVLVRTPGHNAGGLTHVNTVLNTSSAATEQGQQTPLRKAARASVASSHRQRINYRTIWF
jgi:hypothetical protein